MNIALVALRLLAAELYAYDPDDERVAIWQHCGNAEDIEETYIEKARLLVTERPEADA